MRVIAMGVALFAGVALLVPQMAWAQAARWSVDGSGAYCTLSRPVDGTEPTTLVIRSIPTTEKYELMLVRDHWPQRLASRTRGLQVVLQPGGAVHERPVEVIRFGEDVGRGLAARDFPKTFFESFGRLESMRLAVGKRDLGIFAYSGAEKAVEAFDLCGVAKLIERGADPAAFEPGGKLPKPLGDPNEWLLGNNPNLLGHVRPGVRAGVARLNLDVAGRVEACELLETTKDSLSSSACDPLKTAARYEPARDKEGNPVRSVMLISWYYWWRDEPTGG